LRIPRSRWADILQEAGYDSFQIIELPLNYDEIITQTKDLSEIGLGGRLRKATIHLEHVIRKMDEGNWNDAVGECRLVLETLTKDKVLDENGERISADEAINRILKKKWISRKKI